jgi:hypothetical protein
MTIFGSVGRVTTAVRASTASSNGSTAIARGIAGHARRPSSSKANIPPNEDEGKRIVSGGTKAAKSSSAPSSSATTRKSRAKGLRNASLAVPPTTKVGRESFVPLNTLFPDMPEPVRATNHLKKEGEL